MAAFSGFLMVGLVALYDPEHAAPTQLVRAAYVGPRNGFDQVLQNDPAVGLLITTYEDALAAFRNGERDVVVQETRDGPNGTRTVTLLLPDSEIKTTLLVTKFRDLLRTYEKELRIERQDRLDTTVVYVEAPTRASPYYAFAYSVLLPLLIATPVFLAGSIAADGLTQELRTRTLELLRSSPAGDTEILVGKLLTPVLLAPLQVVLWFLLLALNGVPVHNALPLLVLTTALAALFAALSSLLAVWIRREGETQLAYSLLVLLLFAASLLLEPTPLNLIARLAIGTAGRLELLSILGYLGAAGVAIALGLRLSRNLLARPQTG